MRLPVVLFALACPLVNACLVAQPAAPKAIPCSAQPARAVTEADKAVMAGDSSRAEALFRQQLGSSATAANYAGLVHALIDENKVPEAVTEAHAAAAALPQSGDALALVGDALARAGEVPEAAEAYAKAVGVERCSAQAHFGAGRLNDLVGRHLTAAREILAAHAIAPADPAITAAFLVYVRPELRGAAIEKFLGANPVLTPEIVERLRTDQAVVEQHKSCTATKEFASAKIGLEPILFRGKYTRSWGLAVKLNDQKLPVFELDSSVDGIVLNPKDAERAGVHPLLAPTADGATAMPYVGVADKVRIGDVEYHDCPVRVVSAETLDGAESLIGTNFFRDHLIQIDYVAEQVSLSPLPALPGGPQAVLADQFVGKGEEDWSPVYVAGPDVLVPTLINKKGPFLIAMDTGSVRTVLSPELTKRELSMEVDATLNLRGRSGGIVKYMAREGGGDLDVTDMHGADGQRISIYRPVKLPVYRFTKNEVPDTKTIAFDLTPTSHAAGTEVSGLLGFNLLHGYLLEINYRDALAHIVFDQNRRYDVRMADKAFGRELDSE